MSLRARVKVLARRYRVDPAEVAEIAENEARDSRAALEKFARQVERFHHERTEGDPTFSGPNSRSFLGLAQLWASYYDGSPPPSDLTRSLDARFGELTKDAEPTGPLTILAFARRYRELARVGQREIFLNPWEPGVVDLEALISEFVAAAAEEATP